MEAVQRLAKTSSSMRERTTNLILEYHRIGGEVVEDITEAQGEDLAEIGEITTEQIAIGSPEETEDQEEIGVIPQEERREMLMDTEDQIPVIMYVLYIIYQ